MDLLNAASPEQYAAVWARAEIERLKKITELANQTRRNEITNRAFERLGITTRHPMGDLVLSMVRELANQNLNTGEIVERLNDNETVLESRRLHKEKPDLAVKLFWPNQGDRGVHVNLSGIGLTRHAPHPEAAKALVEWMTTPEAQKIFADVNQEFPANPAVPPSAEVATWGKFVADTLPVEVAGKRQAEAIRLMDRAGWN